MRAALYGLGKPTGAKREPLQLSVLYRAEISRQIIGFGPLHWSRLYQAGYVMEPGRIR
jgi:hypothetical protein